MRSFFLSIGILLLAISGILAWGDQPSRRYVYDDCQYNMIYLADPEAPVGLVTIGGSRVGVSTPASEFQAVVDARASDAELVHNLTHGHFALEKEYVLLRDLLERRQVKTALIMMAPFGGNVENTHEDFLTIARLSDIPLAVFTLGIANFEDAVLSVRNIVWRHLNIFSRTTGALRGDETDVNCNRFDYRLDTEMLYRADQAYENEDLGTLDWPIASEEDTAFMRWMEAYRELEEQYGIQIMFLMITATDEPLPPAGFEDDFFERTRMHLITFDREIHHLLAKNGKRDSHHINLQGRQIFLPWLYDKIVEKCERADGCF